MAATALVLSVVSSLVQVSATGGGLSPPDLQAAQTIYAQRYIDFEGWAMSQGGRTLRTWIEPVEGISRRPLKAEFYARVARPDLAARYRARRGGRITAGVVGGVMIPSGLVGIIGQAFANHGQRSPEVGGYVAGGILIPL